jgi:hypothetical protein
LATKVWKFTYYPIDSYSNYTYIFSSRKRARQFAAWFLDVSWDEDLAEWAEEEGETVPTDPDARMDLYERMFDDRAMLGIAFEIEETVLNPIGSVMIHPFAPQVTYA